MAAPGIAIVGCGYVGLALGRRLCRDNAVAVQFEPIVGTTRSNERAAEITAAGLSARHADFADPVALQAAIAECRVVYLTAAATGGQDYRAVYVGGIEALLRACDDGNVDRIIYTSASSVYGQTDGGWVDETSVTEPQSPNGKALLEAERLLLSDASKRGIDATVLRLTGIYGPDRGPQRRLQTLAGSSRSDGDVYLNLVHVDDIVEALRRLLETRHHGVLCLNDDEPTPRRAYYDRQIAAAGLPPIQWQAPDGRLDLGKRVSNLRLKQLLELTLQHPRHLP